MFIADVFVCHDLCMRDRATNNILLSVNWSLEVKKILRICLILTTLYQLNIHTFDQILADTNLQEEKFVLTEKLLFWRKSVQRLSNI